MRLPTKALLLGIGSLTLSLVIAYTAESQVFAQLSWTLFFILLTLLLFTLGDAIIHRIRRKISS